MKSNHRKEISIKSFGSSMTASTIKTAGLRLVLLFVFMYYLWQVLFASATICVFKSTLGIPCPGCGSTRALLAVFHGRFSEAFWWHPLWLLSVLLILGGFYAAVSKGTNLIKKTYANNYFWIVMLILYIGVYIIRMVYLFPKVPPMDFEPNNLYHWLWDLL